MNDKMKTDLRLVAENDDDGAGNSTRAPLTERQQIIMATRLSLTVNAKIPTVYLKAQGTILAQPENLLLDEPFSRLDQELRGKSEI